MAKGKNTRKVKIIACAEGMTLNGFPITREQIEQMAADYDPDFYCGRVNMDHIKTLFPDSTFRSYSLISDVNAIELTKGDLKGKLGLEVTLDIDEKNDEFIVNLNQSGQKIFSSIEFYPELPSTGRAYLTGVALTDYPAAMGAQLITLSTTARGLPATGYYLSSSLETEFELLQAQKNDHENDKEASKNFLSKLGGLLGLERRHNASENDNLRQAIEMTAKQCGCLLDEIESLKHQLAQTQQDLTANQQAFSTLKSEHDTLKQQLSRDDSSNTHRPTMSGGQEILADY